MLARSVAGFVVNGAVRDIAALSSGEVPIYAAGVIPRGPYKDGPGEVNVPIAIDGMVVAPGDIVVGDVDGVMAEPRLAAVVTFEAARAQQGAQSGLHNGRSTSSA